MNYCKTCVYCDKTKGICHTYGIHIDVDKDFCSKHSKEVTRCEICNQIMLAENKFIEQDSEGVWHQYCGRCAELLKTCQTCFNPCEFETNPDPMPKVVMQTVRQGNMQMQSQIKNPERVQKFCPSCSCYDEELGCKRQFNVGCNNKLEFWTSQKS